MAQYVPNWNAANTEDRLQIDPSNNALMVYTGAWQTVTGTGSGSLSKQLLGGGLLAENIPFWAATANTTALATGVMTAAAIYLPKGLVVTSIAHHYGTTASAPGHVWAALYDTAATPALIGQSTDSTSETGAAYAVIKHTLATPYTVAASGVYYAALQATTTVPTLCTTVAAGNAAMLTGGTGAGTMGLTGSFSLCVKSGSSLTDTATATLASPTAQTTVPWVGIF